MLSAGRALSIGTLDIGGSIVQAKSVKYQYLAALVVNFQCVISYGLMEGWTSPSVALLTSHETPLASGKITMEEASWIASLLYISGLFGNIFFGYVINHFGRKLPLMIIAIPTIISWLLVWFGENVYYIYVARLLGGFFGSSGYMIVPIFLSEIADDKIRGTLMSTLILTETAAILMAYIMGTYSGFYATPKFAITLTTIFSILLHFLPESPLFLMKRKKFNKARNSVCFYKNMSKTGEDEVKVNREMDKLKVTLDDMETKTGSLRWSDVTTGIGRKALLIGIILVGINVFSGVFAMTSYTTTIFEETGSSLSPNDSTIITGLIQLIGACLATKLVECGRKLILILACIGAALGLTVLGLYTTLKSLSIEVETVNWIPVVAFSWSIFLSSLGIQTVTLMVLVEIMPVKIKDACVSFCLTLQGLFAFLIIKFIPSSIEILGFDWTMYIFAGVCIFGALLTFISLPETKGKSHEEIMKSLR